MKLIGLCGGSGSGKTSVSDIFSRHGFLIINTDQVYHELTSSPSKCLTELEMEFGKEIINADGSLNRPRLASIVFADGAMDMLRKLNRITHFHVLTRVREIIVEGEACGFIAALADVPLLFESHFNEECDVTIAVLANRETRIRRIMLRDGIEYDAAAARINAQLSDDFLVANCDYVIENNSGIEELNDKVCAVIEKII